MRDIKNFFLCLLILAFTLGCVQMRDYTGTRDGSFGLDVNKGFDQGVDKKDYYLISEDVAIIARDTKDEVVFKIGLPTRVETDLDGYECWVYEDKKIDLFFGDNRLSSWSSSRYEEARAEEEN